jgi:hypothetical protein
MREFTIYMSLALFVAACSTVRKVNSAADSVNTNAIAIAADVHTVAVTAPAVMVAGQQQITRAVDNLETLVLHYTTPLPWYRRASTGMWVAIGILAIWVFKHSRQLKRKADKP